MLLAQAWPGASQRHLALITLHARLTPTGVLGQPRHVVTWNTSCSLLA